MKPKQKKIEFDKEQLGALLGKLIAGLPYFVATVFIAVFVYLTYYTLVPRVDPVLRQKGNEEAAKLDMNFNTKLLKILSGTQVGQKVDTSGGRDPFTPF